MLYGQTTSTLPGSVISTSVGYILQTKPTRQHYKGKHAKLNLQEKKMSFNFIPPVSQTTDLFKICLHHELKNNALYIFYEIFVKYWYFYLWYVNSEFSKVNNNLISLNQLSN